MLRRTFHAIIPHSDRTELRVLLSPEGEGPARCWPLPSYVPENGFFAVAGPLVEGLRAQLGISVVVLRCLKFEVDREVEKRVDAIFCMENLSPGWTPPPDMRWVSAEELREMRLAK